MSVITILIFSILIKIFISFIYSDKDKFGAEFPLVVFIPTKYSPDLQIDLLISPLLLISVSVKKISSFKSIDSIPFFLT